MQVAASAVGTATVPAGGSDGAAVPSGTCGLTGPCPVPRMRVLPPFKAGLVVLLTELSWFITEKGPSPEKRPGEITVTAEVPPVINSAVSEVRMANRTDPRGALAGICSETLSGATDARGTGVSSLITVSRPASAFWKLPAGEASRTSEKSAPTTVA